MTVWTPTGLPLMTLESTQNWRFWHALSSTAPTPRVVWRAPSRLTKSPTIVRPE